MERMGVISKARRLRQRRVGEAKTLRYGSQILLKARRQFVPLFPSFLSINGHLRGSSRAVDGKTAQTGPKMANVSKHTCDMSAVRAALYGGRGPSNWGSGWRKPLKKVIF